MSTQMAVTRSGNVRAELAAFAALAEDDEDDEECVNEYDLDADDNETHEEWERTQACAWVWDYHPNLDEDAVVAMYSEFKVFIDAGHSYVDALAFSGICPSDNPSVNYVRRFDPHCSEEDAIEKYRIYRSYRDEGQSERISRQYAGLL